VLPSTLLGHRVSSRDFLKAFISASFAVAGLIISQRSHSQAARVAGAIVGYCSAAWAFCESLHKKVASMRLIDRLLQFCCSPEILCRLLSKIVDCRLSIWIHRIKTRLTTFPRVRGQRCSRPCGRDSHIEEGPTYSHTSSSSDIIARSLASISQLSLTMLPLQTLLGPNFPSRDFVKVMVTALFGVAVLAISQRSDSRTSKTYWCSYRILFSGMVFFVSL